MNVSLCLNIGILIGIIVFIVSYYILDKGE